MVRVMGERTLKRCSNDFEAMSGDGWEMEISVHKAINEDDGIGIGVCAKVLIVL